MSNLNAESIWNLRSGCKNPACEIDGENSDSSELVNDIHSRLNATLIENRICPSNMSQLIESINQARVRGKYICVAGGRHAMGGQQFLKSGTLLDMTSMKQILHFDGEAGLLEVESGCLWSDLIPALQHRQRGKKEQWTIAQKQTGCDRLSIGGALSANAHGRGLSMAPIVRDVEQFNMVLYDGRSVVCSRTQNRDLFSLAIGGYGLFGIISSVTLRLVPKTVLRRSVELCHADDVVRKMETRAAEGATYGDFQFHIDHKSPDFLKSGILSTYAPIVDPEVFRAGARETANHALTANDWRDLVYLAHTDKSLAFQKYAKHYLSTDGQLYQSDNFQLAAYIDGYHEQLDQRMCDRIGGTELITELYVPRNSLSSFLPDASELLRQENASVIYGTVRLIEKDEETFLPWAKERWACIVLNLHVTHLPHDIAASAKTFCRLIDIAIKYGGSYYLTYHRFASRRQLLTCYPKMGQFIRAKSNYDPDELFRSDWFEHCKRLAP